MPVAPPLFRWTTPSAVLRSFSLPDYATDFSSQVVSSFRQSVSPGNVIAHYPLGGYEEVSVEYIGAFDQTFADEVLAWWSHAARGGLFDFFLEGDMTASVPLYQDAYPPDIAFLLVTSVGAPFLAGREAKIGPIAADADTAKRETFTIDTVTYASPPHPVNTWSLNILTPNALVRNHWGYIPEVVRSKYGFPDCVVLQNEYPLIEEPGNIMRFSLRLRSFAAIVVP